jgi:Tol biopolymer transport system component/DNA-binding winged helix-turn-helix (wHTH) protein
VNANVRLLRPQEQARFARLGEWLIDLPSNRLMRGDRELRPTPKAMAVLRQLMLANGAPLTRNELLDRVWRDAYPTDDVLTHAVTELRRALDDEPRTPRYIETIPKVGYRLLPAVEWLDQPGALAAPVIIEPAGLETLAANGAIVEPVAPQTAPRQPWPLLAVLAALVLLALLLPWLRGASHRDSAPRAQTSLTPLPALLVKPVTSDPDSERFPAVSPDGSTVAYAARRGEEGPRIFLRGLNAAAPIALTHGKAMEEMYPVWSPDGTQIALVRQLGDSCRIVVVAALGGHEREATSCAPNLVDYFDWMPDGKSLVLTRYWHKDEAAEGSGKLAFVDLDTGAERALEYQHDAALPDIQPRVSPDGKRIAFRRGAVPYSDIWVVDANGGAVRRLTQLRSQLRGYDWLADGRHIVFSSDHDGRQQLYLLDVETRAISALGVHGAMFPAAARQRGVVVYQQDNSDLNLLALALDGGEDSSAAQTLAQSTRAENWPAFAPTDDRLMFVSDRSGEPQLWLQPADGSAPFALTQHHALDIALPNWSPDGKRAAYIARGSGRSELYVVEIDAAQSRRVSDADENVRFATFSSDGTQLLYVSDRSGTWQLWRRTLAGGPGEQIGHASAFNASDIGDGRIYLTHARDDGLYALDPASGSEERISGSVRYWNMHGWRAVRGGVYYLGEAPADAAYKEGEGATLYFLPFAGGPPAPVMHLPAAAREPYFSLSSDGRRLVAPVLARDDTDVMQVDVSPLLGGG